MSLFVKICRSILCHDSSLNFRTKSFYSVGFTTALHSINCLVVSPQ